MSVKTKIFGVGGGGTKILDYIIKTGGVQAEFVAVNVGKNSLNDSLATKRIEMPKSKLSSENLYEIATLNSILKSVESIKEEISVAEMIFIVACLGGENSANIALTITNLAKEEKIPVVAIVTKPFVFEGAKREEKARQDEAELKKHINNLIVIPYERLRFIKEEITFANAFEVVRETIFKCIVRTYNLLRDNNTGTLKSGEMKQILEEIGVLSEKEGYDFCENKSEEIKTSSDNENTDEIKDLVYLFANREPIMFKIFKKYKIKKLEESANKLLSKWEVNKLEQGKEYSQNKNNSQSQSKDILDLFKNR